jgi:GNAT superfamily N-acetyltransferase
LTPRPLSPVPADRLGEVRALADAVFVEARDRPPGIARRYPGLLEPGGEGEAVALEEDGRVAASLVLRPCGRPAHGDPWAVAMIGLVAVRPERRSLGLGRRLLRLARSRLEELAAGAAVLWAGRHELYEAAGWREADPGVRGEAAGADAGGLPAGVTAAPIGAVDHAGLNALRARWEPEAPERSAAWWATLPFPAAQVHAVLAGPVAAPSAYALVGERAGERYVYELVGDPAAFEAVWAAVRAGCRRVTVNDRRGGVPHAWLAARGVPFVDHRLAMWLALDERAPAIGRHVPWFDRI